MDILKEIDERIAKESEIMPNINDEILRNKHFGIIETYQKARLLVEQYIEEEAVGNAID